MASHERALVKRARNRDAQRQADDAQRQADESDDGKTSAPPQLYIGLAVLFLVLAAGAAGRHRGGWW